LFNQTRARKRRETITATFRTDESVRLKKRDDGRVSLSLSRDDARVLFEMLRELFAKK
jgi:hypothetical protein